MNTVVNFHINGVVRCNSAPQVCKVLNDTDFSGVLKISTCGSIEIFPDGWGNVTVFFVLIVSPNRVAVCSNCLHTSLVSSSVYATIEASSANSSSLMQSSRVFVLTFSLANWNNFPSDLVRMKTPALMFSDTVDSSAARKRVDKHILALVHG